MKKPTEKTITLAQARQKLERLRNAKRKLLFSVEFIKRGTGKVRKMICRFQVRKHLKGGAIAYDRKALGLVGVFDIQKQDYRNISTEGLLRMTVRGRRYLIKENIALAQHVQPAPECPTPPKK